MQFIESVSFLGRDQIITQLEIEMKEFRRFQYPYKTDKWLNIVQWEEIESYLLKNAKKQKNLKSKDELLSGSSVFGDLSVTFKFVAKAESYIDFMKKNYHLDWILKVKVESLINAATTDTVVQSSESLEYNPIDNQIETSTSRYKPSSQTSFENKAAFEYSPQRVSNENEPKVSSYTPSRITRRSPKSEQDKSNESASQKMIELFGIDDDDKHDIASNCNGDNKQGDNSPTLKESRKRRKKRFPVYVESSSSEDNKEEEKREVQVRADKKVKSNQPTITSMLTKRSDETLETLSKTTQRSKRSKSSKLSKNKSCPMKIVPKEVIPFDSEEFSYLNNFIEKTNREEAQKNLRKEELKSLEMLNCNDLTNDELKKFVNEFRPEIKRLYAYDRTARNKHYDPLALTTSNVFTGKQISYICREIENLREVNDRGSKENILSDMILPEFVIKVFCKEFKMNRDEAIDRLKTQEERQILYNTEQL